MKWTAKVNSCLKQLALPVASVQSTK